MTYYTIEQAFSHSSHMKLIHTNINNQNKINLRKELSYWPQWQLYASLQEMHKTELQTTKNQVHAIWNPCTA